MKNISKLYQLYTYKYFDYKKMNYNLYLKPNFNAKELNDDYINLNFKLNESSANYELKIDSEILKDFNLNLSDEIVIKTKDKKNNNYRAKLIGTLSKHTFILQFN